MNRAAVLILVALVCASSAAQAADAALRCVQHQLNALGHGAGAADGLWGGVTRGAFNRLQVARGAAAFPVSLSRGSAVVICRQLGLDEPDLQAYWPSQARPFRVITGAGEDAASRAIIEDAATVALAQLSEQFGLRLPLPVTILAASDRDPLRDLWRDALGAGFRDEAFETIYRQSCTRAGGIGGFAASGFVALCFPASPEALSLHAQWQLKTTVAHEVFHVAQRQLVGQIAQSHPPPRVGSLGPEWLIEGTATYVSLRATLHVAHLPLSYGRLRGKLAGGDADLARYEPYAVRAQDLDGLYDHGSYATYLLATAADDRALVRYYEALGLGTPWSVAFEQAFGLSPTAFYATYRDDMGKSGK